MQTLYIKLKLLESGFAELQYALQQPAKYETQRLNLSAIKDLIKQAKGSYYMLLPDLKGMGQQLFFWLDGHGRWLSRAIANCTEEGLILAIDSSQSLSYLPWEILHDGTQFLVEHTNPVVVPVRLVDAPVQESLAQERPLRILFMATAPENVEPQLDFEREEAQILSATQDLPLVLRVEESGCIAELGKLWSRYREPFDVFHLTGHASIQNNQPYFVTETETGERHAAKVEEIAAALRFRLPQLVFLSGCRTGETLSDGVIPSLAASLVQQGCRAVLGWGRPVLDVSATATATYLYSKLAAGYKLSEALASTYQHLLNENFTDWHLLRLYVRGKCPEAFVEPLGDQIWIPNEPIHEQFLDPDGQVRVATPQEFVGRRRVLQYSLKGLRSSTKLGVILHGLGGVGKSTVAARLLERLPSYDKIFIYRELDQDKLLKQLFEQCTSETGKEILQGKLALTQCLTKFLREGLNQAEQRFIFVLDDFEANIEIRPDGVQVLKPEAVEVLLSLLKAISQSRFPHRLIITCRYDFQLSELNHRLHREILTALHGADLQKKCNRLSSFSSKSEINPELQIKARQIADGNPHLLEWLNKILQAEQVNHAQILERTEKAIEKAANEFRESILAEELLKQQPVNLRRMLAFSLVYELPVPKSAITAVCPKVFNLDDYIPRTISLGLLEVSNFQGETLYRVPRILEPLLDFPKDAEALYSTSAQHLEKFWLLEILQGTTDDMRGELTDSVSVRVSEIRLLEIYRLASEGKELEILLRANFMLGMRWNKKGQYRAVAQLCQLTLMHGIASPRLFYCLAKAEEKLGKVDECLQHYQLALDLLPEYCEAERAAVLHDFADLYASQGNNEKALELCRQAIEVDEKLDNKGGKAKSLGLLAGITHNQGKREEALRIYQDAYELAKQGSNSHHIAVIQNNIALLQVELGKLDAWNEIYSEVFDVTNSSTNIRDKIVLLNNIAMSKFKEGRIKEVQAIYQEINRLLDINDDTWVKADILHNFATFYSEMGQLEQALILYKKALEIHKINKNIKRQATTTRELGVLYSKQQDFSKAIELIEESYRIDESIGNIEGQADALKWIASILIDHNNLSDALPKLEKALELNKNTSNLEGQSSVLRKLGFVYSKQNNFEKARAFLPQALEISKLTLNLQNRAGILELLGELLIYQGEIDKAIVYLKESLSIYQTFGTQDTERVQELIINAKWKKVNILGEVAQERASQDYIAEALDICVQALDLAEEICHIQGQAAILFLMGQLLIERDFETGLEKLRKALKMSQELNFPGKELMQPFLDEVLNEEIARLYQLSQDKLKEQEIEEAVSLAERCLSIARDNSYVEWQSIILVFLGQVIAAQGNYKIGINHLQTALSINQQQELEKVEKIQKFIYRVQHNEAIIQYNLANSEAEKGHIEEAINLFIKTLDFQRNINYLELQSATLGSLGQLLAIQGRSKEGLNYLHEALDVAEKLQLAENVERIQEIINRIKPSE
ncbi:MAG: tetratricopeptide repeat protein [Komarekiella atlantica HA4396-MV6]|nr:tetratricopeptide repeat protein [Komarekiella atlantica HA4396-MV6]